MDDPRDRDVLVYFPYILVRIGCARCTRTGAFRLARLAEKFGANISLDNLIAKLTWDCAFRNARHPIMGHCEARYLDLGPPPRPPPDLPPKPLRVIPGGRLRAHDDPLAECREMLRQVQPTRRKRPQDR